MNSDQINIDNVPIPTYAYFNKTNSSLTDTLTWKSNFEQAVKNACQGIDPTSGSITSKPDNLTDYQSKSWDNFKKKNPNTADNVAASVVAGVPLDNLGGDKDNQIKYLACQVAKMHAREYDSNNFSMSSGMGGIREVFNKFAAMKPYLMVIFFISVFLYLQGILGSFDIGYNIATGLFKGESGGDLNYWIGLLVGVTLPFFIIMIMFSSEICKALTQEEHYDITKNPYGDETGVSKQEKRMDYWIVTLFVLFIYGFIGVLYTIGAVDKKMNNLILLIVMGILVLITVVMYVFYAYTPFIATATDDSNEFSTQPTTFEVYVKKILDVDTVETNQNQDTNIKRMFMFSVLIIYVLALAFFKINQGQIGEGKWWGSLIRGATGASAIMVLPILWVFNTVMAFNYFYMYPILLIVARGFRYVGQLLTYKYMNKSGTVKNGMNSSFVREFDEAEMREYSPTWSLIGVSLLKSFMNMCGYENKFSKDIVEPDSFQKNLSQNSFVSSFFILKMFSMKEKTKTGMTASIVLLVLTFIIWYVILYGFDNINTVKYTTELNLPDTTNLLS